MKKIILYFLAVICFAGLATGNRKAASRKQFGPEIGRPNILFVLIDDMGWKDAGFAGSTYYQTPNIDKLAAEGMRFTNAYSAAPVCTPARGAIFSGKCPARTKLTGVFSGQAGPDDRLFDKSKYQGRMDQYLEARHRRVLPKSEITFAQAMADGSYKTGFFGKWHIGECKNYYPEDRGFHVAKGYRLKAAPTPKSGHWMKTFYKYGANLEGIDRDAYVADVLTDECVKFIKENKGKPWFAVLSHYLVHMPIQPKPEKLKKYKNKPTTDQSNPGYASMVESVDESIGSLMHALEELGLKDNTLVIFTSDNGGLTPNITSNYPLMGGKSFPLEAGMKVPFIARWPNKIKPGISDERIVGMDIYPTILAAAGLPLKPKQHVDGIDLMPLLTNNTKLKNRPIVFHYPHYSHATGPFSSIIDNDWKLIRFYNDSEGEYLLYNLATDPEEQNDLSKTEPERCKTLANQLSVLLKDMDAEMPKANPDYSSKELAQRRPRFRGKNGWINRGHFTSKSTAELAANERKIFEARLKEGSNSNKPNPIITDD